MKPTDYGSVVKPWVYDHRCPSGPVFRHHCGSLILWSHIEEHEHLCEQEGD